MELRNIQHISDTYLCSNCGACFSICAKKAIEFKWSSMGRLFASVNEDLCVGCRTCMKVCPSINDTGLNDKSTDSYLGTIGKVYVGRSSNPVIYKNAQSGGACTAILSFLFRKRMIDAAVVCQMSYGEKEPIVEPQVITCIEDLLKTQKSCYTPVSLLTILSQCASYNTVAIIGLPCHLHGLTLLQKQSMRYCNFKYKLGLICDRTICKGVQDVNLSLANISGPYKIDWRRKDFKYNGIYYPYETAPVVLYNEKAEIQVFPNYYRIELKDMFTSPRCRVCYDKLATCSDITLGDPWAMTEVDGKHGDSLLIVRTQKGQEVLHNMLKEGDICLYEHDLEEVITGQHINERRDSVMKYSKALKEITGSDSYLLKSSLNTIKCDDERNNLDEFINREKELEKEEIKSIALEKIEKRSKCIRQENALTKRVLRKALIIAKKTFKI